jgi:hypothetical protein
VSQNIFLDPSVSSLPSLTPESIGNGTLTVDKLTHFTITQNYTAVCTATDPFTVFNIVGSLDGAAGVAVVGTQFIDEDKKIFLTINQGPILFQVGDTFEFAVEQGTDLNQTNLDTYDELPQKNFGQGIIGDNAGNDNLRFSKVLQLAKITIEDLLFTSKTSGPLGNLLSIEYILGTHLTPASLVIQDLTYTAATPGEIGNDIQIEYLDFDPAIASEALIQDIQFSAKVPGVAGDLISIEYITGGTAGSEVVNVIGDKVQVQIEDGVSNADQIRIAIGSNPTAFAMLDGYSTGTGLEPQSIQTETFLTGGVNAIGDAGNEVVTVLANYISVKLESGVSTALQVATAILASPGALTLVTPTITGNASTAQTAPAAVENLSGGTENVGIPGNEIVELDGSNISITFVNGESTAQQIKTAVENNINVNALITVSLLGTGAEFQPSPFERSNLKGGAGVGTYSFNTNEISDQANFHEGNAAILSKGIYNQGSEITLGTSYKRGKVSLDDKISANNSGPKVDNTQKTINNLIQNGKVVIFSVNDGRMVWSKPASTLSTTDDIKIIFVETGIYNTILASNFPKSVADGEHLYFEVNRLLNANVTLLKSTKVPTGENIFRLVSRQGTSLFWFDGSLQREGKTVRVGEGSGVGAWQEQLGTANGIQTIFPIPSGYFPVSQESILVFSNSHKFVTSEWIYNSTFNQIEFVTAPEIGSEPYIFFLTDGDKITPPVADGVEQTYIHVVSALETLNKEIQLIAAPISANKVMVDIVGGTTQINGIDFIIAGDKFMWAGYQLDGDLIVGDKIRFHYFS